MRMCVYGFVRVGVLIARRLYEYTPVGVIMGLSTGSMGGSLTYIETVLDKVRSTFPCLVTLF
jgi:ATP-dependent Lon protease